MNISAVIPAKGKSNRVKNKNLYKIRGKSLIYRACEKTLNCKTISNVYLDTESDAIIEDCKDLITVGLKVIKRPKELANNYIGANELMVWALHSIEPCDLICQTFATSPMLTSKTMDNVINKFLSLKGHDSFFTVLKLQEYFWTEKNYPMNFHVDRLPNSSELVPIFMETHGLYGIYPEVLLEGKTRIGKNSTMISIPKIESIDIDTEEDLEIARKLLLCIQE